MKKTILITGGVGYIGSHAVVAFEQAGYRTVTLDNLSSSSIESLDGVEQILGYRPIFCEGDIGDAAFLRFLFLQYGFDGVIHFAGLKAVGESCEHPILYHENNIGRSIILFQIMEEYGVRNIVFSSSATVYRADNISPLTENMPLGTTNPYGTSKLVIEQLLVDIARHSGWSVTLLRYFNPIGAHPSGYIGELPSGTPNNLLPYVMDVAVGKRDLVRVYGDNYPTVDGTGVRDYIDVCDLVEAHIVAYEHLTTGCTPINIGTGKGTSVLEMISLARQVTGRDIPYEIAPRRSGDIAECYAGVDNAREILSWSSSTSIESSIANGWRFRMHAYQKSSE